MEFCPACGLLLQIDPGTGGHRLRLFCPVCPYVCPMQNKVPRPIPLPRRRFFCTVALCRSDDSHRFVFDVVPFPLTVPQIVKKAKVVKKEVEPIFSKADAMKLAPKTASETSALFFVLWSYYILCALLRAMIRFLSQAGDSFAIC